MFSVIIPLYNKESFIARTLQSVLDQTFQEFEIIIVNDGSTDRSVKEVERFNDERIRLVEQTNAGVSAARNRGIDEAKHDLIAFLDADDLWDMDFLETIFSLVVKYSTCSIFATNYFILTHDNVKRQLIINGLPKDFTDGVILNYFTIASQSDPLICSSAVVVNKNALKLINGFPIGIRAGEDLLTWARLASQFDMAYTLSRKATFIRAKDIPNQRRSLDFHDRVGEGLQELLNNGDRDKIQDLNRYIAYWYVIRVILFLRFGLNNEAAGALQKVAQYTNKNLKYYTLLFIIFMPKWISPSLYQILKNIQNTFSIIKVVVKGYMK
jgi:glycosyltransferase involved in cell wall biosynthesis